LLGCLSLQLKLCITTGYAIAKPAAAFQISGNGLVKVVTLFYQ